MIVRFRDQSTEDIFDGADTKAARKIPKTIWSVARRKLDQLNLAEDVRELAIPPGNHLESLAGNLAGFYSVRVNDQFRIVFRFAEGHATDVRIIDYH